jgi:hypothetical protein
MIEEWRYHENCFFRQGNYRIDGHIPEKTVLVSNPGDDFFCTLETNDGR